MNTSGNHQEFSQINLAPVHLKNLEDICGMFGKARITVRRWYREGAPIVFDGSRYSAEYNQLMAWLVSHYSASSSVRKDGIPVQ